MNRTARGGHNSLRLLSLHADRALRLLADVVFYGACALMALGAVLTVALS